MAKPKKSTTKTQRHEGGTKGSRLFFVNFVPPSCLRVEKPAFGFGWRRD